MIRRHVTMTYVGDEPAKMPTVLEYDPGDPLAVTVAFGEPAVRWTFARDLLADGMHLRLAGHGDVTVWHVNATVWIRLSSPDGRALIAAPWAEVSAFLTDTYSVVRPGCEVHTGLDAELMALLEEG